jgi:hypothetical protein
MQWYSEGWRSGAVVQWCSGAVRGGGGAVRCSEGGGGAVRCSEGWQCSGAVRGGGAVVQCRSEG